MSRMNSRPTALERAFDLARSGDCAGVEDVRKKLKSEGYSVEQLTGRTLIRQLRDLCQAAAPAEPAAKAG
jgi:hypothetical protein